MDCLDAMKEMPDNAYDLAIVDPPYGIGDFWKGGDLSSKKYKKNKRKRTPMER